MDLSFLSPIVDAARGHLYGLFGWLLLTAIVNTVFHFVTPADADAWAERNPFVAKVAALFRRAGFEPVALLTLVVSFFSANPPPPGPLGRKKDDPTAVPPVAGALVLVGALSLLGSTSACSWAQSHEGQLEVDGVKLAMCITTQLIAGQTDPGAIAKACGAPLVPEVFALITAQKNQIAAQRDVGFKEGAKATVGVCKP